MLHSTTCFRNHCVVVASSMVLELYLMLQRFTKCFPWIGLVLLTTNPQGLHSIHSQCSVWGSYHLHQEITGRKLFSGVTCGPENYSQIFVFHVFSFGQNVSCKKKLHDLIIYFEIDLLSCNVLHDRTICFGNRFGNRLAWMAV